MEDDIPVATSRNDSHGQPKVTALQKTGPKKRGGGLRCRASTLDYEDGAHSFRM